MNEVSEKFASMIADYIEIAHQKDPSITLPLHAYHELCRLLDVRRPFLKVLKWMKKYRNIAIKKYITFFMNGACMRLAAVNEAMIRYTMSCI